MPFKTKSADINMFVTNLFQSGELFNSICNNYILGFEKEI